MGKMTKYGTLTEVSKCSRLPPGASVAIVNTRHLQELLGNTGCHNTSPTRGGDKTHQYTATFPSHLCAKETSSRIRVSQSKTLVYLARNCMWLAEFVAPVA